MDIEMQGIHTWDAKLKFKELGFDVAGEVLGVALSFPNKFGTLTAGLWPVVSFVEGDMDGLGVAFVNTLGVEIWVTGLKVGGDVVDWK